MGTPVLEGVSKHLGSGRRVGTSHSSSSSPRLGFDTRVQVKTLRNAAVLYEAATSDRQRYRNKSRFDFDTLHQSVHEFRIVDRSEQHMQQIHRAETQPASAVDVPLEGCPVTSALPEITLATFNWTGMDGVGDGQPPGLWPNWWSTLEDVDLPGDLAN